MRLQHALPDARILYVSATGATTVENLAYAQRLGLWGSDTASDAPPRARPTPPKAAQPDAACPFASRAQFVAAMQEGGIAAMEVVARDLKALGLYAARSLSYEGVEVEMLEHTLTPEQIRIYDAYAGAFQIIHRNLGEALKAANITGDGGTLNRQAKAAAHSAFESNKQRFFNHLITAMKCPTLIRAIERRSRRRPRRHRAAGLDLRGADGAPPRGDSGRRMGRSVRGRDTSRVRSRLSRAQLPHAAS